MTSPRMTVLVVGATGSIGRLVVEEAIRQGRFRLMRRWSSVTSPAPTRFPVQWTVSTLSCSPSARTALEKWGLRVSITAACATSWAPWVRGQRASR
jgi:uncharacterized protein YbjT (DUF2867 family)